MKRENRGGYSNSPDEVGPGTFDDPLWDLPTDAEKLPCGCPMDSFLHREGCRFNLAGQPIIREPTCPLPICR